MKGAYSYSIGDHTEAVEVGSRLRRCLSIKPRHMNGEIQYMTIEQPLTDQQVNSGHAYKTITLNTPNKYCTVEPRWTPQYNGQISGSQLFPINIYTAPP